MSETETDVRDGSEAGATGTGEGNARAGGPWRIRDHDHDDQERARGDEGNRDDVGEGSPCETRIGRVRDPGTSRGTAVGARGSPVDRGGEECASRCGRA